MSTPVERVIFVFLDGVGIGPDDPDRNPFLRARLPWLRQALGGMPTLDRPSIGTAAAASVPLDATLGVEGTPQSGTGQTSLLTGQNGARIFGRHFGPWVPVALRPVLAESNLLVRAIRSGIATTFANAYPQGAPGQRAMRRPAGPPLAAESAGLLTRHHRELAAGRAVASEIVNTGWRTRLGYTHLPRPTPEAAGATLATISLEARLTFFAHYSTDHAGHRGGMAGAVQALETVDRFLAGLMPVLSPGALVFVASDHGNIEDVAAGHTRNPVLGLLLGDRAPARIGGLDSIMDVPGRVLAWLGADDVPPDPGTAQPRP